MTWSCGGMKDGQNGVARLEMGILLTDGDWWSGPARRVR